METEQIVILVLLGAVAILLLVIYFMRARSHKKAVAYAARAVSKRTDELLRLVAIPFLWAIRSELLKENYDQIGQYFRQIVKEPGIISVILVDNNGRIRLSSDKKWEGKSYDSQFSFPLGGAERLVVKSERSGMKLIISPITGINEMLGTIVIQYSPPEEIS